MILEFYNIIEGGEPWGSMSYSNGSCNRSRRSLCAAINNPARYIPLDEKNRRRVTCQQNFSKLPSSLSGPRQLGTNPATTAVSPFHVRSAIGRAGVDGGERGGIGCGRRRLGERSGLEKHSGGEIR